LFHPLHVCEHFIDLVDCHPSIWQLGCAIGTWPPKSGGAMPSSRDRICSTHTGDGGIIMNIDKGKMFSLNASGSVIFQLLDKGFDDEKIIEEVVRRFEIPADLAKRDLDSFRKALKTCALFTDNQLPGSE
jgi:hypothetical protein